MRFLLAPNLSTLDDLERPKCPLAEVNKNSSAQQKNFNKDWLMLSAAKCRPVSVVSKKYKVYADMYRLLPLQCHAKRGYETACRLSVCVIFTQVENTSKIIARPNSLGSLLSLTPTGAVWCNGNTPKMGVEYGWGKTKLIRAAISLAS